MMHIVYTIVMVSQIISDMCFIFISTVLRLYLLSVFPGIEFEFFS